MLRKSILSLIGLVVSQAVAIAGPVPEASEFERIAWQALPVESRYEYHERLKKGPVHTPRRDPDATPRSDEIAITDSGWELVINRDAGTLLSLAAEDFQNYLAISMQVDVDFLKEDSTDDWESRRKAIVAGTRDELTRCGESLESSKDYEIITSPDHIVVCGYDERGAAYGLYNLEARMNLREGPYLPDDLQESRESLYQTRMVLNWLGWMEWSDQYLSHLVHDGFDAIYASAYANPNGAEGTAHYTLIREQDPVAMKDLLERAGRYGIKVYTPLLYRVTGEAENERRLRELVRDILTKFPEIKGFILLTEGFFFDQWFGAGGHGQQDLKGWARQWTRAVGIVLEEAQRLSPEFEVLPWEYNIDFRPQQVDLKRYFISQLPEEAVPFLTWENGKAINVDGYSGYIRDYSISVVGPAEVTAAQIEEAKRRGMRVYSKADTFASWQFGTTPYLPIPYQWYRRYKALEEYQVDGTHESWSYGYNPNFILEMRAWYSWSGAPDLDSLLQQLARRIFGSGSEDHVLKAWRVFSEAIQMLPDTGPSFGTNFALGNPMFFSQPEPRTMTIEYSWWDEEKWMSHRAARINPYWPFTRNSFTFMPDFSNAVNKAEQYARTRSGVARIEENADRLESQPFLPVFNQGLLKTADRLEEGLESYRRAALRAPSAKQTNALKEVLMVEQMQRMLRSCAAILEFEDLRFRLFQEGFSKGDKRRFLDRMEILLVEEQVRTEAALENSLRDSRLGYEMEMDYIYAPHVLREKLEELRKTLLVEVPAFREKQGL